MKRWTVGLSIAMISVAGWGLPPASAGPSEEAAYAQGLSCVEGAFAALREGTNGWAPKAARIPDRAPESAWERALAYFQGSAGAAHVSDAAKLRGLLDRRGLDAEETSALIRLHGKYFRIDLIARGWDRGGSHARPATTPPLPEYFQLPDASSARAYFESPGKRHVADAGRLPAVMARLRSDPSSVGEDDKETLVRLASQFEGWDARKDIEARADVP